MKKILVILLLITVSSNLFAQAADFNFSVEVGFALDGNYTSVKYSDHYKEKHYDKPIFIEFAPEVDFFNGLLNVFGSVRVNMYKNKSNYSFCPVSLTSVIGAKISFKGLSLILEHMCKHGVHPNGKNYLPEQTENDSYTQISLKYSTKDK